MTNRPTDAPPAVPGKPIDAPDTGKPAPVPTPDGGGHGNPPPPPPAQ